MSATGNIPFFEMFCLDAPEDLRRAFEGARVEELELDQEHNAAEVKLEVFAPLAAELCREMEACLRERFGLSQVRIWAPEPEPIPMDELPEEEPACQPKLIPPMPEPELSEAEELFRRTEELRAQALRDLPQVSLPAEEKKKADGPKPILGRRVKKKPIPMSELNLDMGTVLVSGRVFAVEHRELKKRGAWVMSFDMTDNTGSIRVSKFLIKEEAEPLVKAIKVNQYLSVQGRVSLNRYDNDMTLEPTDIFEVPHEDRKDLAEGDKRVELHLHTRMSSLDGLTEVKDAIQRAAKWGHRAIAITDHGVVQSFPDAAAAGKKNGIKILYGVEGYFINDVDDRVVIHGEQDIDFDQEIVAFDLETTGLDPRREEITEIGAVVLRNGKVEERFQTFVDPGRKLTPEIIRLTGITDDMLKGAPSPAEAVRAFLDFAKGRVLAAHNSEFDISFLLAVCKREGIPFEPTHIDTLILSQNLLPELQKHKLDMVADALQLPAFQHHRASDDAATVAYMLPPFFEMLRQRQIHRLSQINPAMRSLRSQQGKAGRYPKHIILLVQTQEGLKNLYKLISKSHLEHFRRVPVIPKSLLEQHREGLILGSACESGELFTAVIAGKEWSELKRLASYYDFLEIQPLCNNAFLIPGGKAKDEEQLRDFNRMVVKLGKALNKPVCATGDVHFLEPEDEIYRRILLASKQFSDVDRPCPLYFKTTDEMLEEFAYLGEEEAQEVVINAPNRIADLCQEIKLLPDGLFTPKIENSAEDLQRLVRDRMHALYGDNPPELVESRVETELHDILSRKYDVIYMSAQKLVADSMAHGYLVGSRGSVGSSIVAYMSGITEVNSLPAHYRCPKCRYSDFESGKGYGCGADMEDANCPHCGTLMDKDGFDIPFETFLGFGGDKVPDIDLNFSGEYQANAHKYTETLFGRDHVFKAGTIGTLAEKTAYGYTKKYLEERGMKVTKAEENRLAAGCVGIKKTTGQHPGGLVIIPQDMDVTDFCPVQHPADDKDSDVITTHFDYHKMEDNLLKLDELGHDDPTMIRMLEDMTGMDAKTIRLGDPDTMGIFSSPVNLGLPEDDPIVGQTGSIGIPEFGTGFTRQMLVDTKPDQFDTLVRLSGFSHGTDVWLGNAKDLILSGTATVNETIGCRDDIMLYLISKGMDEKRAFKIMEAVRKGRGLPEGAEEEMKAAGVQEWYIESCKKIKYLFPKAHAVAYVMMAFRIAWFKVHQPLAFYSAYFYRRSQKDAFDAEMMTQGIDAVRDKIREIENNPEATAKEKDLQTTLEAVYEFYLRGFDFAPIDLYESDPTKFLIAGESSLRPPFVAISGLGESAARDIVEQRQKGKQYISIEEFSMSCPKVSKTHIEQLTSLGAFGAMPETSQLTLF